MLGSESFQSGLLVPWVLADVGGQGPKVLAVLAAFLSSLTWVYKTQLSNIQKVGDADLGVGEIDLYPNYYSPFRVSGHFEIKYDQKTPTSFMNQGQH